MSAHVNGRSPRDDLPINKYFRAMTDLCASELHFQVGQPAIFLIKGSLTALDMPAIDEEKIRELCCPLLDLRNQELFNQAGRTEFLHQVTYKGKFWHFQVSLFMKVNNVGMVARKVDPT